jgi:hypothetical protein
MATIIKLALVVALLTAAFQASRAMVSNYQFEDDVEQVLLFTPNASDAELTQSVLKLAAEYDLVVDAADIKITARAAERVVDITYVVDVPLLPGLVTRPVTFHPSASARVFTPPAR